MPTTNFRGKPITDADVLEAMERFNRDRRSTFTRWKTYAVKHEGNQYPPKEILRMVVGDVGNLSGGEPTNRYFRELGFTVGEVDDDVATPDSVIEDAIDVTLHLRGSPSESTRSCLSSVNLSSNSWRRMTTVVKGDLHELSRVFISRIEPV